MYIQNNNNNNSDNLLNKERLKCCCLSWKRSHWWNWSMSSTIFHLLLSKKVRSV